MNLPIDKKAHFLAGAAISATLVAYGVGPTVAISVAMVIGALKEVWDSFGNGTPDLNDFLVTAAGSCVVLPTLAI